MKKIWRNMIIGAAAALALSGYVAGALVNILPKKESPVYKYLVSQGITPENAKILAPKINPELTDNEREFAKIISGYSSDLQKACVTSDILGNKHISKAELEATRKATLEGIANPEEVYAVLANFSGDTNPEKYSQQNTKSALEGLVSFYDLFKEVKKLDDEHIKFFVDNPNRILMDNSVVINGETTEENITRALLRNVKSDKNDNIYVVLSSPNPVPHASEYLSAETSESLSAENSNSIESNGKVISNSALLYALAYQEDNPKYGRLIIIGQTFGAKKFLSTIPRSISSSLSSPEKEPLTYLSNAYAFISPNDDSDYNKNFLTYLAESIQRNPNLSMKELIERENQAHQSRGKAEVSYYNLLGENRSPLESKLYDEPFPF